MVHVFEIVSSLALALLALSGVFMQAELHKGHYRLGTFSYYTNLSNLIIGLWQAAIFVTTLTGGTLYDNLTAPGVRYALTLMIWVTHLVYHFLLVPDFKKRDMEKFKGEYYTYQNLTVHYVVPLLTVLQWLVCADKEVPFLAVIAWLIIPVLYLFYAMGRAMFLGPEPKSGVYRYPYVFMDLDVQGLKNWIKNVSLAFVFYVALGLVLYGISWIFRAF